MEMIAMDCHKRYSFASVQGPDGRLVHEQRIEHRRGHATAIGAVARHLAEATYWMLIKNEPYKERGIPEVSSRGA